MDKQAMARTEPSPGPVQAAAPPEFVAFFRAEYRTLMVVVMFVGATFEEADEAAASAMEEVLRRWDQIDAPLAYGKRAALSNFYKEKDRGLDRIRQRLKQGAEARRDGAVDASMNVWEDQQWVMQVLGSLPPAQGEALALVVDGFTPTEIARLLGKTADAVRQNLHAARARLTLALLDQDRGAQRSGHPPSQPRKEAHEL
jgi:DNA-directed RNA polymerase specialized sigma24 family protein